MRKPIVAVFTAAALVFTALIGASPATADPTGGAAYVAFGDSEAAGTGNLPYVAGEPCYRSKKSYPILAGGVSYACAGATVPDVATQAQAAVAAGHLGPDTQKVSIQVGINDLTFALPGVPDRVGWQELLAYCFVAGDAACEAARSTIASPTFGGLPALLQGIRAVIGADAQILVLGYPRLFGSFSGTCAIGTYQRTPVSVTSAQAATVNSGIGQLNLSLAVVTDFSQQGATFVPLNGGFTPGLFDGHGLCDSAESWIGSLMPETSRNWVRSLHITSPGQKAIAGLIG